MNAMLKLCWSWGSPNETKLDVCQRLQNGERMQNANVCGTANERLPTFAERPTNVCQRLQDGQQPFANVCRTATCKRLPTFAEPPTNVECQRSQNGSASNVCS